MVIASIKQFIKEYRFDEALEIVDETLKSSDSNELKIIRNQILLKMLNFHDALHNSLRLLKKVEEIEDRINLIIVVIKASFELGELQSIPEQLHLLDHLLEMNSINPELKILAHNLKGDYDAYLGNLDDAISNYGISRKLAENLANPDLQGTILNRLAYLYRLKGDFQTSMTLSRSNSNYKISEKNKARNFLNIGVLLSTRNDQKSALVNLKDAQRIAEKLNNRYLMSNIYFYMIKVYLEQSKINKAEELLQKLTIIDYFNSPTHELRCNLANALILAKSSRLTNKIKAQEILENIIQEDIIDFELSIIAIRQIIEILILELRLYGEEEVLSELNQLIVAMNSMANKQNSTVYIVESLLYMSKLQYITNRPVIALDILDQVIELADNANLRHIHAFSINEKKKLNEELKKQKNLTLKHQNLLEKMNSINIEDYLSKISNEIYS
jgi:hypothetical protein